MEALENLIYKNKNTLDMYQPVAETVTPPTLLKVNML